MTEDNTAEQIRVLEEHIDHLRWEGEPASDQSDKSDPDDYYFR